MSRLEKLISELGMDFELKPFLDSGDNRIIKENVIYKLLSHKAGKKITLKRTTYSYPGRGRPYSITLTPRNLEIFFRYYGIRYKEEASDEIAKTFNTSSANVFKISRDIKRIITQTARSNIWYSFLDYS